MRKKKRLLSWDTAVKRHRLATEKRVGAKRDLLFGSCMDTWQRCGVTFRDGA
ncbi:unnamed protein product [Arabidopsis thaliana]|uniref:Uncharacterized protein n=3 Tax=Arabidopsis TaxID=3701 RepID=A0A654EV40_ARATH|nr:uncharacterized protein AT2G22241 [Arabidopsis thaliana]AEC07282.1 hypothetical protein AT2G22241 [Arabidopsis thaliana]KAG7641659.1 hypothetical protein ISN44_As02g016570 [Arabidopsis suecica]CAA0369385.1 unnamed protein product [Arabidopsis thaliana]VYS53144.1 unnamed protein product [Arabidopsis thaliana]|eukprot:NP_001118360.1 hypothetical protein AT2G22241 [Arabidopsis thaliana]